MPENPHHGSDRLGKEVDRRVVLPVSPADDKDNAAAVNNLWGQLKIPDPFVWSHAETLASAGRELDAPVVDVGAAMRGDCAGIRRAAEQVSGACSSHGLFQVTGHGLDPTLARAALDGAADFFRLPLATKQSASRAPGNVTGYTVAHADRFTANLPWKETLSFGHRDRRTSGSHVVVDYFTSTLGSDFKPLGVVYQDYCNAMKEVSLTIMEVIGVSLGVGRSYYRDFFADGSSIMRCNYYPPCPEPERTLGTGPHCDPSALTVLLQDGDVDGLQVLVDGEWRTVRPRPGALVVSIGDTFMSCVWYACRRCRMGGTGAASTARWCTGSGSAGRWSSSSARARTAWCARRRAS
ncbi:gibberellin 20 oxidase 2-like isoform X2 [Miscanthus floridulus]|uniref:gibberellin 20 oxidase 2-like isoform X2 n=1 Tax=Miscanthus floridulus TaxID=154761 RepID=UPI00345AF2E3